MKNSGKYMLPALVCWLCCSCASIVPVSNEIIERVGGQTELDKFQYYISRGIVMDRTENETDAGVVAGQAKIVSKTQQDKIKIKKSTPGVVINYRYHEHMGIYSLFVAFEADDDKYLHFISYDHGKSYALYAPFPDTQDNVIFYGTTPYRYAVTNGLMPDKTETGDTPCLLIKLKKRYIVEKNSRTVKGRKIGQ